MPRCDREPPGPRGGRERDARIRADVRPGLPRSARRRGPCELRRRPTARSQGRRATAQLASNANRYDTGWTAFSNYSGHLIPTDWLCKQPSTRGADDLRAVGRGLLLRHTSQAPDRLAALAHRAGFAFVCHRADLGAVYASIPPCDYVVIAVKAGGAAAQAEGFDIRVGETLDLRVEPSLPTGFGYRWLLVRCGKGRARFTSPADRPAVTLQADVPGMLHVKIEMIGPRHMVSATREFHAGLVELEDGQSVANDGALRVDVAVAGESEDHFDPAYLVTVNEPGVDFGAGLFSRRMQPSLARRLTRLLQLIAQTGATGPLVVVQAHVPGAPGIEGQGRRLILEHASPLARLGALAHAAGFTYVRRHGSRVEVRQSPDSIVEISGVDHVAEGAVVPLSVRPRAEPLGIAVAGGKAYTANAGTDTVSEIDTATGAVLRCHKVGWNPLAVALSSDGRPPYFQPTPQATASRR